MNILKTTLLFLLGIILLTACDTLETSNPNIRPVESIKPIKDEQLIYTISQNDVLEIFIYKHSDLSRDVIVRPDGKISLSLIGDVQAVGMTPSKLDDEITKRYSDYLVSPDVSIAVKKFAGEKVFVLGEIRSPGVYNFVGRTSLIEILAQAGSWTEYAKISNIFIVRGDITATPEVIMVDLTKVLKGDIQGNIAMYPKDIVYIPSTFIGDVGRFVRDYLGPLSSVLTTAITLDYFRTTRSSK